MEEIRWNEILTFLSHVDKKTKVCILVFLWTPRPHMELDHRACVVKSQTFESNLCSKAPDYLISSFFKTLDHSKTSASGF